MKIQYLGTGAAEGVPAEFCNCKTCRIVRERGGKEIHTRSQIVIDGDLGLEFPPDAYYHSLRFHVDLSAIRYLIVTHSHMDHFYAHDFILRGYKYAFDMTSPRLDIYGNEEIGKVFEECTRREMKPDVKPSISFHPMRLYAEYSIGDYTVTPLRAQHSVTETAFVFLIEKEGKSYLHLTDTGRLPSDVYEYLSSKGKRVDLVCFDCTFVNFTKGEVGRHMGIEDDMAVKEKLILCGACNENTRYYITHFSHCNHPLSETLDEIEKKYGVTALYDGMTVEL